MYQSIFLQLHVVHWNPLCWGIPLELKWRFYLAQVESYSHQKNPPTEGIPMHYIKLQKNSLVHRGGGSNVTIWGLLVFRPFFSVDPLATARSWWFLIFRPFFSVDPLATARLLYEVYRFRPLVSIRGAHWWFSGRILACHAGGPGSIPGQCSWLSSWLFFDSAQGRRKIKGQALSPRRGIEPRSPA